MTYHAKVSIIHCYAPTNDHEDVDEEDIYQQLWDLVNKILHHDIKIVMGNMNAQMRSDRSRFERVHKLHAYGTWMENEDHFTQFCYKIGSIIFQQKDIHKIT